MSMYISKMCSAIIEKGSGWNTDLATAFFHSFTNAIKILEVKSPIKLDCIKKYEFHWQPSDRYYI